MKHNPQKWLLIVFICAAQLLFDAVYSPAGIGKVNSKNSLSKQTYPDNMFDLRYHDVGLIYLPVTNYGIHGYEASTGTAGGVWPKGSGQAYIFGAGVWIGAIKGGNKLVSVGYNPNSGTSEMVPGFEYDPTHNYEFNSEGVRVLLSTDYPSLIEENSLPDWPMGYYHLDPDGDPATADADTVMTWAEAGNDYKPVTVSVQDSYAWFSDADQTYKFDAGADVLGVHIIQQGYSWNYFFNQNFAFLTYDIINVSDQALEDTYLSVVVDPDLGDSSDDMVGFDESRNLGYCYDNDGREAGWSTNAGYLGYVFLESPIDATTGEQLGLTAFRIFTIDVDPGTDVERYDVMAANGTFDLDSSPEDKRFCMPTGPFTLNPGDTARVVIGIICARDLTSLQAASDLAQQMYNENWTSPSPPPEPEMTLIPGDGKVLIVWDDKAETALDPVTNIQDFEGYRLYKSRTGIGALGNWNPADPTTEWQLIAQWDLIDGIGDGSPINPDDGYDEYHPDDKYLGDDTGLVHMFTDTDVINGAEYHYAITTYDQGTAGLRSLECGLILNKNRRSVRPGFYKIGYERPATLPVSHTAGNASCDMPQVSLSPITSDVIDTEYQVRFQNNNGQKTFSVFDLNSQQEVLSGSTMLSGESVYVNGVYLSITDEVTEGALKSNGWLNSPATNWSFSNFAGIKPFPVDYELRFTAAGDTTVYPANLVLPFEIWRVELDTSYKANATFIFTSSPLDTTPAMRNLLTNGDEIKVKEDYFDTATLSWKSGFTLQFVVQIPDSAEVRPQIGDVYKFELTKPLTPADTYNFTTIAEKISADAAMLKDVKVVPNPYIVRNTWERSKDYSNLQFINLPEVCTIRVYTLAGDHVRTIEHNEHLESDKPGWEWWDLLTHNDQKVVSGVYIFHVDAPSLGEYIGKFAIIR
ncbi:MAG: hypothetical protein ACOY90_11080 [Candidatus Zhuqueibacterota bacterium]